MVRATSGTKVTVPVLTAVVASAAMVLAVASSSELMHSPAQDSGSIPSLQPLQAPSSSPSPKPAQNAPSQEPSLSSSPSAEAAQAWQAQSSGSALPAVPSLPAQLNLSSSSPQIASVSSVSLPPVHSERGADGLPAASLRCSFEGGLLNCGACRTDGDCPAGSGCVADQQTRRTQCLPSECQQDEQCSGQRVCRAVTAGVSGPVIRRCVEAGERKAGEPCDLLFVSRSGACQQGLVCHRGECSTPCGQQDAGGCPDGFQCEQGLNGGACFADCRVAGCNPGQLCKRLNDTDYQCLDSVQGQCPEQPCAQGERCNMRLSRGRAVFWCAARCNPLQQDSCPSGQVCGVGAPTESTCFQSCDPNQADSCPQGWQCATVNEDFSSFGCRPIPGSPSQVGVMSLPRQ